jgi:Abortive infection C-terminus
LVLTERSLTANDKDDLPELVRNAQLALAVHPTSASPGPDGSDAVKKILGGATNVATGIAELRNRGYGTGHGPGQRRTGLGPRHARLAIVGAKMWCEFMLDTLGDEQAPWRKPHGAISKNPS